VQLGYPELKKHTYTHALKVFQNRELRKILGPKKEVHETEQNSKTRSFMIGCNSPSSLLRRLVVLLRIFWASLAVKEWCAIAFC
jgi:hypothetical protein